CRTIDSSRPLSCTYLFTGPAPTAIYTLSLHDALPICTVNSKQSAINCRCVSLDYRGVGISLRGEIRTSRNEALQIRLRRSVAAPDRKSTRLNSSHRTISYAVFCLKKKNESSVHHSNNY